MRARLVLVLVGWAAACGGRSTSPDGGTGVPGDAGADATADAAPTDAGSTHDAGVDAQSDAGRCLVEVCECQTPEVDVVSCPREAPFCCYFEEDDSGNPPQCYSTDDPRPPLKITCYENLLDSAEPSDCREEDVNDEVPGRSIEYPDRCPDERPNCCGDPRGRVVCADHVLAGWIGCSIGILVDCADPLRTTPDSTLCPDDYPWCCINSGNAVCSARYPPPEGWNCDLD